MKIQRKRILDFASLLVVTVLLIALFNLHVQKDALVRKVELLQYQLTSSQGDIERSINGISHKNRVSHCDIDGANHIKMLRPQDIVHEPVDCIWVGLQNYTKFKMCVHRMAEDKWVSGSLRKDGIWEGHIVKRFIDKLNDFPSAIVLDVGAQLGTYGLYAATLRRTVIMVEAMHHNANHILHSLRRNNMTERLCRDIFLTRNVAGSSSNAPFGVIYDEANNNGATAWGKDKPPGNFKTASKQTMSILLDEILPLMDGFDTVIMKMDIEGSECEALKGMDRIFKEKQIVAIFMEAAHFSKSKGDRQRPPCDLLSQLSRVKSHGLIPRSFEGEELNVTNWESWPWDLVWERREE